MSLTTLTVSNLVDKEIPRGLYCCERDALGNIRYCPYWSIDITQPEQMNGHCSYLDKGDFEDEEISFLWDMVKECDINLTCEHS